MSKWEQSLISLKCHSFEHKTQVKLVTIHSNFTEASVFLTLDVLGILVKPKNVYMESYDLQHTWLENGDYMPRWSDNWNHSHISCLPERF